MASWADSGAPTSLLLSSPLLSSPLLFTWPNQSGRAQSGKSTLVERISSGNGQAMATGSEGAKSIIDLGLSYSVIDVGDEADEGKHKPTLSSGPLHGLDPQVVTGQS